MEDIILLGFGGHAKSVIDTIEKQNKYQIVGFTDKSRDKVYKKYQTIGTDDDLEKIFQKGVKNAFITIGYLGDSAIRKQLFYRLKEIGYHIPVIVDDTAVIATDARIGEGTYVGKNAVINSDASVGKMCIVNTGAIVEHDCVVGDFSHVAVGAVVCGMSKVGAETLIGANATVIQCMDVGNQSKVGAGAIVLKQVPDNTTVSGVWKGSKQQRGDGSE